MGRAGVSRISVGFTRSKGCCNWVWSGSPESVLGLHVVKVVVIGYPESVLGLHVVKVVVIGSPETVLNLHVDSSGTKFNLNLEQKIKILNKNNE